ncbi:MAG: MBOAT family protein [Bacteroidales bacterium]|nr:MBOAT family protein [Bacteroidales bacterium]
MIIDFLYKIFAFDDNSPLLFTQFYFWVFFAVVLVFLSFMHSKILLRNTFLFFVSVFFYYKTSGIFTLILLSATLISFFVGKQVFRCQRNASRNAWLAVGIVANLSVLCYFKYAYFITDMLNNLFGFELEVVDYFAMIGNEMFGEGTFHVDAIFLPVGISFFTFQCISYLMDIYRKRIEPVRSILNYGFYVSFFPQLVAGPIVRAKDFIHQLYRPYNLSRRQFGIAVFWILNGLAKKIILSDYIAVNFVDRVFANPGMYTGFENLSALFGYSLQVYADFSGYTDIATGVALIMGFYLPINFNSPYKATNAGGFWKRWHISLSKWLQDYLYIPMGGNRNATFGTYAVIITIAIIGTVLSGSIWVAIILATIASVLAIVALVAPQRRKKITTNINAMNTMLLGGLWHGASWNFMIWGGLNGIGMVIYKLWKPLNVYWRTLVVWAFCAFAYWLADVTAQPVFNIAVIWLGATAVGTSLRMLYNLVRLPWALSWLERAWAITQTFVFITFTRLFFRSGSNLDPAEANETAWNTAKSMVNQIGSTWNTTQIPQILTEFWQIFVLIAVGMIIHWLPDRLKRRYRLAFSAIPLPLMAVVVVAVVFIIYQFVTADLQKFIYFQF